MPLKQKKVVGTLKGYDQLMNLVLDDVKETMRGKRDSFNGTEGPVQEKALIREN